MVFRYTDLKMRVANAKVRRVPKLMEIDITGSDLVFNLKESDASDDEESGDVMEKEEGGSTPIQDQIALLYLRFSCDLLKCRYRIIYYCISVT